MELQEFFRQEPTYHLRPPDEFPQPMAYREERFSLLRCHSLTCRVFLTDAYLLPLSDRAAIVDPHHFLLWTDHPTIEVGRTDDKLDLHGLPEFFRCLPTHRLRETLALFDASCHAFPLPCGKVLLCRALEEQVPAVRLTPYEAPTIAPKRPTVMEMPLRWRKSCPTPGLRRRQWPERGTSGGYWRSPAGPCWAALMAARLVSDLRANIGIVDQERRTCTDVELCGQYHIRCKTPLEEFFA